MDLQLDADGEVIAQVENWDELQKLLDKESAHWDWLRGVTAPPLTNFVNSFRSWWDGARHATTTFQNRGENISAASQVAEYFRTGGLLHHESPKGALVLDIYKDAGPVAGAAAHAFLTGGFSLSDVRTPDVLLGVLLTALPNVRTAAAIEERLRAERANYRNAMKSAATSLTKLRDDATAEWRSLIARSALLGLNTLRERTREWREAQAEWQKLADEAKADIQNTDKTFRDFMQLQGPVEY